MQVILGRCHAGVLASVRAMTSPMSGSETLVDGARPKQGWCSLERQPGHGDTWTLCEGSDASARSLTSRHIARHIASLASQKLFHAARPASSAPRPARTRPTPLRPRLLAQRCPRLRPIQAAPGPASNAQQPPVTSTYTPTTPRNPPATPYTLPLLMTARP